MLPAIKSEQAATWLVKQFRAGEVKGGSIDELLRHASRFGGDGGTQAAAAYTKEHIKTADAQLMRSRRSRTAPVSVAASWTTPRMPGQRSWYQGAAWCDEAA